MATTAPSPPTTLAAAVEAGDADAVRAMLAAGEDPRGADPHGRSPIALAYHHAHLAPRMPGVVDALLDVGADPLGADQYGGAMLLFAVYCGQDEVARRALARIPLPPQTVRGYSMDLLACAASGGMPWLVERCLAAGYDATVVDANGSTALIGAVACPLRPNPPRVEARVAIVRMLLDAGAPLEHARDGDWGTALHMAVDRGHPDLVALLLDLGADIRATTPGGSTAMHKALYAPDATFALLVARGACVDQADACGWTPLHHAVAVGHVARVDALLAAGARGDLATTAARKSGRRKVPAGATARAVAAQFKRWALEAALAKRGW